MSVPKSSLKRRGGVSYLHHLEGAMRRRVSFRAVSIEVCMSGTAYLFRTPISREEFLNNSAVSVV